jgi:type IV fimbrial biogenesis protein FimT
MGGEKFAHGLTHSGLTLVELMVAIAMVAIVLAIGIPEYQNFTTSNTLLAELHTLKDDIALARSEASTTGSNIIICASNDPTSSTPACSGFNEWNTGWVVISPTSSSCSAIRGTPLKVQDAFLSKNTVVFAAATGTAPTSFCFNRNGLPTSTNTTTSTTLSGMFIFNTSDNNADDSLCLGINEAGHLNILANGQGGCT